MIRKRVVDMALARSLVEASEREMKYIQTVTPTIDGAATIIRGIYENFRRLGEALLASEGLEGDHEESIAALLKLSVKTERPLAVLDSLRRIRHSINYKGYQPTEADLEDVLSIMSACWEAVLAEIKKRVFR